MTVRRSGRERSKASSYYDDEKKRVEREELLKSAEKAAPETDDEREEEEENESEVESIESDQEEDDNSESSSDEDFVSKPRSSTPRRKQKPTPSKKPTRSPIQIQVQMSKSKAKSNTAKLTSPFSRKMTHKPTKTNPKTIQNALQTLSNKLYKLDQNNNNKKGNERLKNSLFTALLNSYKGQPKGAKGESKSSSSSQTPTRLYHENDLYYTQPVTKYTTSLSQIAFDLVDDFNTTNNPTSMHIKLLNLLFLSIGGTSKSMILEEDEENKDDDDDTEMQSDGDEGKSQSSKKSSGGHVISDLEDLDSDDWNHITTTLVEDMRSTPMECIPFCCDPNGALHWNAMQKLSKIAHDEGRPQTVSERDVVVKKGNGSLTLAVREYRSIYEEFWYVLGTVALVEGGMSGDKDTGINKSDNEEDSDSDMSSDEEDGTATSKKRKRKNSSPKANKMKKPKKNSNSSSATKFDTEIVDGILSRIIDLVSVGQPDIRAAATTAALYLLHAVADKTAFVQERLEVTSRQYAAAIGSNKKTKRKSGGTTGAKAESLKYQIDSLKRTCVDLEHIIETFFVKATFMHRYRDSNMYIRASCLQALGRMAIVRPDLFLMDKYLKYLGWLMSDKDECVRNAALEGLLNPFQVVKSQQHSKITEKIDLSAMERVISKFLKRIVDSVIDIHDSVQENGMKMMLALMRNGFLDEPEDKGENEEDLMSEEMWDQVNLMALETDTTSVVRRDALYFIMEQLEDFDDGDNDEDEIEDFDDSENVIPKKKKTKTILSNVSDRKIAQRLDAIASWAAHTLTAGRVPIEKIRIRLVDHLVHSLRSMPEHKSIVTNWSAIVRAIKEDNVAMTSQGTSAGEKADVAKQRVLVQMLICAAKAEVGSIDANFLNTDLDPDVVGILGKNIAAKAAESTGPKRKINKASSNLQHESLSTVLIKALPNLLIQFKSDSTIVESLVSLPRYFIPSVFSLSERKTDFIALTKNLTDIYLHSNDEKVLINSALSLASLCKGGHARAVEAKTAVKNTVIELHSRILLYISVDETDKEQLLGSDSEDNLSTTPRSNDIEKHYALYYNLKRIGVLAKLIDVSDYMGNGENDNDHIEEFCNFISDGLTHRLTTYKAKVVGSTEEQTKDSENEQNVWEKKDKRLIQITSLIVYEGLQFLLSVVSWKVRSMQQDNQVLMDEEQLVKAIDEDEDDMEETDHVAIRLRDRLIVLVELCFEQHLPESEEGDLYSTEQHEWSDSIQEIGGLIASDLRSLFMKEWTNASSPLLRAAAITEDSRLIAGYIRYFRSKELEVLRDNGEEDSEAKDNARFLLLPLVRSVASNWKLGNRREASHALSHITGSGILSSEIIETLSRLLKKVEPVRLLEAHMASLRLTYEDWLNNDPEEIMGDNLTQGTDDVTMNAFQELEEKHHNQFKNLLSQAQRFSSSLGVRKLSDKRLSPGLLGFMREGIRFSFSGSDDLLLGSRLSFLTVLCKYAIWIKRNKAHLSEVTQYLHEKESELKQQETDERESTGEEFEGIHEDDLKALAAFRSTMGLAESPIFSPDASDSVFDSRTTPDSRSGKSLSSVGNTLDESRDMVSDMSTMSVPSSAKRTSRGSTGSAISKMSSARSSLSPLYEVGEDEDVDSPNDGTTPGTMVSAKSTGSKSDFTDRISVYDEESPTSGSSPQTASLKSTGLKSEITDGGYESSSSLVSPTGSKTQSTFDGEQSDVDEKSDAGSEILETH